MKTLVLKKPHSSYESLRHQHDSFVQQAMKSSHACHRAIELEQWRIGKERHNKLCQKLTGVSLLAKSLAQKLGPEMPKESAEASEISELISETISQTIILAEKILSIETRIMNYEPKKLPITSDRKK
jgi:signal transduction histidine kinase